MPRRVEDEDEMYFNPHPYVRDDSAVRSRILGGFYFNPHPYVRDDVRQSNRENSIFISIHIPT